MSDIVLFNAAFEYIFLCLRFYFAMLRLAICMNLPCSSSSFFKKFHAQGNCTEIKLLQTVKSVLKPFTQKRLRTEKFTRKLFRQRRKITLIWLAICIFPDDSQLMLMSLMIQTWTGVMWNKMRSRNNKMWSGNKQNKCCKYPAVMSPISITC